MRYSPALPTPAGTHTAATQATPDTCRKIGLRVLQTPQHITEAKKIVTPAAAPHEEPGTRAKYSCHLLVLMLVCATYIMASGHHLTCRGGRT